MAEGDVRKFVIYEVWTRSKIVSARNYATALAENDPVPPADDLDLCNWHAVEIPQENAE